METDHLIKLAEEFEELAKKTKHDYTRVEWYSHQAMNCRRMARSFPEPKVDSHHTQFHWLDQKEKRH